jgi:hypothetical protein
MNKRFVPTTCIDGAHMFNLLIILQAASSDGLTAGEVWSGIPHDGPAFVVYAMVLASCYAVWKGSRPKKGM